MRLRNIPEAKEIIAKSPCVIHNPQERRGHWDQVFEKKAPLRIEIGMGKGRFMMDMAATYLDINFVGVEVYESVLLRAVQKLEKEEEIKNLYFLREDAKNLPDIFEEGEVDRIYLNFSDPWPKDRHAKRRLTHRGFLAIYDKILKKDGVIEFKTDNRGLFEFSLLEAQEAGWQILEKTFDLHNDEVMNKDNIMTEYEEKFSSKGNPICKMIISRK